MKANRNAAAVSQTQVVHYSQAGYRNNWQSDSERAPRRTGESILAGIVVVLVVIVVLVVVL